MKAQGISRDTLPWKAPFQPFAAWVGFIGSTIITLVAGFPVFLKGEWNTSDFVASYIGIPIFIVPIIGWKFWHRTKVSAQYQSMPSHCIMFVDNDLVRACCHHRPLVWSSSRWRDFAAQEPTQYAMGTIYRLACIGIVQRLAGVIKFDIRTYNLMSRQCVIVIDEKKLQKPAL